MKNSQKHWIAVVALVMAAAVCSSAQSAPPAALGSGLDARRSFARDFQHELANKGFAARVVLQGLEQNALRIEASGLTPESIYSLVTSPEIEQSARSIGFKTIVFAKRTRGRWDYDVQRESMLWQPALF